jgi:hypothetical protein
MCSISGPDQRHLGCTFGHATEAATCAAVPSGSTSIEGGSTSNEGRLDLERRAARPRTEGGSTSNEGRLDEVVLYVEGENAGAIRLYESFGFTHAARDTDVLYARS